MVAQQNSKDAVHSVLGVNRQQLQPSALVENGLVKLGMVAMELSERGRGEGLEDQAFEAWSHFASQLVFCYFLQLTNITSLLNKLRTKVSLFSEHIVLSQALFVTISNGCILCFLDSLFLFHLEALIVW